MQKNEFNVLFINDEYIPSLWGALKLAKDGFTNSYIAGNFVEAIWIIKNYRIDLLVIDVFSFGANIIGNYLEETAFAVYIWNKYKIPHIYTPTIAKKTWHDISLKKSKPLSIIGFPCHPKIFLDAINAAYASNSIIRSKRQKVRKILKEKDKNTIRLLIKESRTIFSINTISSMRMLNGKQEEVIEDLCIRTFRN